MQSAAVAGRRAAPDGCAGYNTLSIARCNSLGLQRGPTRHAPLSPACGSQPARSWALSCCSPCCAPLPPSGERTESGRPACLGARCATQAPRPGTSLGGPASWGRPMPHAQLYAILGVKTLLLTAYADSSPPTCTPLPQQVLPFASAGPRSSTSLGSLSIAPKQQKERHRSRDGHPSKPDALCQQRADKDQEAGCVEESPASFESPTVSSALLTRLCPRGACCGGFSRCSPPVAVIRGMRKKWARPMQCRVQQGNSNQHCRSPPARPWLTALGSPPTPLAHCPRPWLQSSSSFSTPCLASLARSSMSWQCAQTSCGDRWALRSCGPQTTCRPYVNPACPPASPACPPGLLHAYISSPFRSPHSTSLAGAPPAGVDSVCGHCSGHQRAARHAGLPLL